jgi:regulator of sirC expression with transglutaminase-like and TPR domain
MPPTADQILFAHVVDRPEDQIDLGVAALMVGEWEYQGLDVAHYVTVIDQFANRVRSAVKPAPNEAFADIRALNDVLFDKLGFRGNDDDYYDPKNSFLNEVIDRRVGIPITLSVLYIEVARRIGTHLSGIAFPGHFLVRCDRGDEILIIDPFHMGLTLDEEELLRRLRRVTGKDAEIEGGMLQPASKRAILLRMLSNLAGIFQRDGDLGRSLAVLERMRILDRDDAQIERRLVSLRRRAGELN